MRLIGKLAAPSAQSMEQPAAKKLGVATIALAILLAWLPLQTPLAVVMFQYGHHQTLARAMLVAKDAFAAVLILYLFARYWRRLRFQWFDWAAVVYVALIGVYSIVPWLLGSHISVVSVTTSARELAVPVELYALGRLALVAGADVRFLVRWFLAVAALAAAFTVYAYVFLPALFFQTTLDVVSFVRVVQGVPNVNSLWDISALAQFNGGYGTWYPRALGPFTQPVGTGHYFVLPLVLAVAAFLQSLDQKRWWTALVMVILGLLFAGAEITPISRGSWLAAGLAGLLCSLVYRRPVFILAALALAGAVVFVVHPLHLSVTSVLGMSDPSGLNHISAWDRGIQTITQNPLGLGVGQSGQFGQVLATGDSAGSGVGENMYLELWVSAGPLGLLAFLAWMAGLLWRLAAVRQRARMPSWMVIGCGAALLGYAVSALLSSALMRFTTSASVWLVVGLCVGLVLASQQAAEEPAAAGVDAGATVPASSAG